MNFKLPLSFFLLSFATIVIQNVASQDTGTTVKNTNSTHESSSAGSQYLSDDPIVLGLSKDQQAKPEKKKKGIQGRSLFSTFQRAVGSAFKDKSESGKKKLQEEIKYYKNRLGGGITLLKRDGSDANQTWTKGNPIKVLVHGFTPNVFEKNATKKIKDQYILDIADGYTNKSSQLNVITVDWTKLSSYTLLEYYQAVDSVQYAGDDVANFLVTLQNKGLISNWKDVHLIGFSLGSHVTGIAGNKIQSSGGGKVGRITGIDPAGPLFDDGNGTYTVGLEKALEQSDAEYVDIIHCNAGHLLGKGESDARSGALGTTVQAGHADFYPDGGEAQKVCSYMENKKGCSHLECTKIYARTINENLLSCPCDDYITFKLGKCSCTGEDNGVYLGEPVNIEKARGKYFLEIEKFSK